MDIGLTMEITILVTGSGAPGISGTLYSLINNPDGTVFRIITTDMQEFPVGKYLSHAFYRLPAPENPDYLPALKAIVEQEKVQVILPQTTREIEMLSLRKTEIEAWGVKVVVSGHEAIRYANDKFNILEVCKQVGVPYPEFSLVKDVIQLETAIRALGYPEKKVIVKPRLSNGQRGVRIITDQALSLASYLNHKPSSMDIDLASFLRIFEGITDFPELIVSEYMPGMEYTVDMYKSDGHEVIIPRSRDVIRSGISFETTTDLGRTDIIDYSKKLADALQLEYCFGFQFKLDDRNVPKILESNPRVQGTMVASSMAGFNMIYYAVMSAIGHDRIKDIRVLDRLTFKRSWGGVGIDNQGNETGRI